MTKKMYLCKPPSPPARAEAVYHWGTAQWNRPTGASGMHGKILFHIKQRVKFSDGYRVNIGYIRVSSGGQRTDRQLEGIALDRVFTDKTSGKDMDRPEFQACLRSLQAGDMLHVHSIDRLTRSLQDLLLILENMADRHVTVKFYKENLTFSGESSPFQRLHLQIIGAVAEFERSLIRERQREGIALAKKRGKYKGRKKRLTEEEITALAVRAIQHKESIMTLAREFGISRQTAYRYLQHARGNGHACADGPLQGMESHVTC